MEVPGELFIDNVFVNFGPSARRIRFTGTSTRDDDPRKTQPGEEGVDLSDRDIYNTYIRVFDQYEIDIEMTKHRHSYINSGIM